MRALKTVGSLALLGTAMTGAAQATPPLPGPEDIVASHAREVDGVRMRHTVEKLVSFGTRHTLSSQTDPNRGIGAALRWTDAQFKSFGLPTVRPCQTFTGKRVPKPTAICDAVAIQRGTERPNDVVIITGHIDSRVSDVMNVTANAPGANDDGSGTAAVIEAARVLSKHKFPGTIVYAALSGEEQGLYGGKVLADYAKAQGWNVVANLNNDIIGNSCGSDGVCDRATVRVFSEGPRWQGHEDLAAQIRSLGGENDAPSRNISRFLDRLAERVGPPVNLEVRQVWRNDRFGRGGDHTEFLNLGFPAVRFSVAVENYNQQHQDLRVEKGVEYGDTVDKMDFGYLAAVTQLNVAALAWLASAPPPPEPTAEGAVSTDTTIQFKAVPGALRYIVRWRRTDSNQWPYYEQMRSVGSDSAAPANGCFISGGTCEVVLKGVRVDDWVFGVASVSRDGYESPVASAVPGGAFKPYMKPKEKP
ncbi:M20/M25/M40 family metallo-hydrolase [Sphingomonas sinipercae]|uniref:M20/M25/M40 family metallo-hydrolase n=1 Tax=Sphingomonas sinipercae TaxID=2714944 RepID=A0A6G7ZM80_9SPHN|nr:M28 family peptidase [Sphingomonas sinipercae]QIL02035.1 M20/M25/M40 family metallo-hydrolase [Sphingomonas sinipercae]